MPETKPKRHQEKSRAKALSHKRGHTIYIWLVLNSPQTSWAIFILRWKDQLAVLCAKANKMFKRFRSSSLKISLPVDRVADRCAPGVHHQ